MSELAILLARVSSISTFSTSLLKCLLKVSANSSLLLIVLLLLFKRMNSLWKPLSKRRGLTVFQNFVLSEKTLWSTFPKKTYFSFAEKAYPEFSLAIKTPSRFLLLVFKNLFLSFDLFIIAFLDSLVIKLQLFERIYFIFFGACLLRTDNTVSWKFDSGAFLAIKVQ